MNEHNVTTNYTFDSYCKKRVSFILPTMNRAHLLASALERCRGIKGPNDELLVIDGLSRDNTREVVEKYRDIVDIFVSERDVSSPHAHNKGYLLAAGKYIKELSDDDLFYPEAIEQAIHVMDEHPDIDLLICGGTKEKHGKTWNSYVPPGVNYGKSVADVFIHECSGGVGHFIRRSSLARLGIIYPERMNCDGALVVEVISRGGMVKFCRINSYHHRIHGGSISVTKVSEYERETIRLFEEHFSRLSLFYIWWRFFHKHSVLRTQARNMLHSMLGKLFGEEYIRRTRKKKRMQKMENQHVVWDGGFS